MKKSVSVLILMLLVIALLVVTACYGVRIGDKGLKSVFDDGAINLGLDLVGGSSITLEAIPEISGTSENPSDETADTGITDDDMNAVVAILRNRVTNAGYTEAQVSRINGKDRVRVDIPNVGDPEQAASLLGATAQLTFFYLDSDGNYVPVLTGDQVVSAKVETQPDAYGTQQIVVALKLNETARESFANATEINAASQTPIYIMLDDALISYPVPRERIDSTDCIISGGFDAEEAANLANLISSGNLPCKLDVVEKRAVGASLGEQAFTKAMFAGLIGVLLVMLFMIIMYQLPGLVSAISLIGYIAITAICVVGFRINLSLPGIAGIFLTIGMAVDANVIIFERIREELNSGKSVKASVKSGFNRAFTAIIDSNITTLIAAVVLWIFGTGAIQGFAITLFLGVIISLITALLFTKIFLNALVGIGVTNIKLFGAKYADNN